MIYWAQLLHFYQPPTQSPSVLRKICDESYRPLIRVFLQYPQARVTVNINGALTEMLHDCGHDDIIDGLRQLAKKGQIEFTGSGKYHPILPLIPRREVERQIQLNYRTNRQFFRNFYEPQGFFLPEMCYSKETVSPILNSGHKWIILSGIACACPDSWPVDAIHYVKEGNERLAVFFRDDVVSNKISFRSLQPSEFLENLKYIKGNKKKIYVVTAMDAETFGHHIQHWEELFLADVYEQIEPSGEALASLKQATVLAHQHSLFFENGKIAEEVQAVTVSDLLELFPTGRRVEPLASSWSTSAQDLATENPYPLWKERGNEVHRLQWEHLDITIALVDKAMEVADSDEAKRFAAIARGLLDRALHSCQFWWASRRPMWDINLIHMGLLEQLRAIVNAYRAINLSQADEDIKRDYYHKLVAARDVRSKIIDRLFVW
jgi:alpha-amylase/alpha-mannosidase (GH57 family)